MKMPVDQPPTINPFSNFAMSNFLPIIPTMDIHWHGNLVEVKESGEVLISWKNVEATVGDPKFRSMGARLCADVLLAVRDRTDKPLPDEAPR